MKKHVFITGLPRTGTTFLIAYYKTLGFNVGKAKQKSLDYLMSKRHRSHGGLEVLRDPGAYRMSRSDLRPIEVIKHPWGPADQWSPWEVLNRFNLTFDYIILTSRGIREAVESNSKATIGRGKLNPLNQEAWKSRMIERAPTQLRALSEWAASTNSKIITIEFPRSIDDFEYLWGQLGPTVTLASKRVARAKWEELRDPNFVHFRT